MRRRQRLSTARHPAYRGAACAAGLRSSPPLQLGDLGCDMCGLCARRRCVVSLGRWQADHSGSRYRQQRLFSGVGETRAQLPAAKQPQPQRCGAHTQHAASAPSWTHRKHSPAAATSCSSAPAAQLRARKATPHRRASPWRAQGPAGTCRHGRRPARAMQRQEREEESAAVPGKSRWLSGLRSESLLFCLLTSALASPAPLRRA